jgi:hypothetical protein
MSAPSTKKSVVIYGFFNTQYGRLGAIKLEQLDALLLSLKTYWDYSNNKALLAELRTLDKQPALEDYELAYML